MKDASSRRGFLALTTSLGAALASCGGGDGGAPAEAPSRLGKPVSSYGERSRFSAERRFIAPTKTPEQAASLTPLQDSEGVITPSALHFERHHSGIPDLDPSVHELLLHGLVERPLRFSMDALKRMPSVSVIRFVECSGNSRSEWSKPAPTAQMSSGMASCSEWTGVPLRTVLDEAGLKPEAKWLICEGADACRMARSLPIEKALDDCLLVYGQNGEALRPEQGYPLRLLVPGWEGNINVKWLRVLKATAGPSETRDETSKYTDLMPDGSSRQFTFAMEAKSVITTPSGGQALPGPGFLEIRGLAWSGRGLIEKVEVSVDGGSTWEVAQLQEPRFPKAFTRFRLPWSWSGAETTIQSRATDETGYIQPTVQELVAVRGTESSYHNNGVKAWKVLADGSVTNV
ncbi:MAG: sulfite dehydrogenase [Acidobacteria bacterium]|nr:sulfite dehydrogenase [Acidobacteriota bacterium]